MTGLEPLPFAAAYARLTFGISVVADTLRHFVHDWLGRALPQPVARGLQSLAARLGWDRRVVRINLGDIVAVLGRKPVT